MPFLHATVLCTIPILFKSIVLFSIRMIFFSSSEFHDIVYSVHASVGMGVLRLPPNIHEPCPQVSCLVAEVMA